MDLLEGDIQPDAVRLADTVSANEDGSPVAWINKMVLRKVEIFSASKQEHHTWREVSLAHNHPLLPGRQFGYDTDLPPPSVAEADVFTSLLSRVESADMNAKGVILKAFDQYRLKTCIDFTPWKGEQDYISVFKGSG